MRRIGAVVEWQIEPMEVLGAISPRLPAPGGGGMGAVVGGQMEPMEVLGAISPRLPAPVGRLFPVGISRSRHGSRRVGPRPAQRFNRTAERFREADFLRPGQGGAALLPSRLLRQHAPD